MVCCIVQPLQFPCGCFVVVVSLLRLFGCSFVVVLLLWFCCATAVIVVLLVFLLLVLGCFVMSYAYCCCFVVIVVSFVQPLSLFGACCWCCCCFSCFSCCLVVVVVVVSLCNCCHCCFSCFSSFSIGLFHHVICLLLLFHCGCGFVVQPVSLFGDCCWCHHVIIVIIVIIIVFLVFLLLFGCWIEGGDFLADRRFFKFFLSFNI